VLVLGCALVWNITRPRVPARREPEADEGW
jgi:hypothetical protein